MLMAGPGEFPTPAVGCVAPASQYEAVRREALVSRINRKPGRAGACASLAGRPRYFRVRTETRGGDADIGLHRASSNRSIVPDPGSQNQIEVLDTWIPPCITAQEDSTAGVLVGSCPSRTAHREGRLVALHADVRGSEHPWERSGHLGSYSPQRLQGPSRWLGPCSLCSSA
jgi:hypothetical protein